MRNIFTLSIFILFLSIGYSQASYSTGDDLFYDENIELNLVHNDEVLCFFNEKNNMHQKPYDPGDNNSNMNKEAVDDDVNSGYIYDWADKQNHKGEPEIEMIKGLSDCSTSSTAYDLCEGENFTVTHGTTGSCDSDARLYYYNGYTGSGTYGTYGTDQYYSTVTNASPGTYTFSTRIRGRNGTSYCYSSISVTVYDRPGATSVSGGGDHCESATLTASGGSGGTIYWQNTTSNGTSTGTASTSQTVTSSGTYYFRAEDDGCWGTQGSASVNIQQPPTAPTDISGTTTICMGETTTLTATGGTEGDGCTYQWYIGNCGSGSVLGTGSSIDVSPTTNTTYYVRRVGDSPCDGVTTDCANATVTVETFSTAPTNALASPDSICEGETITLNRVGGSLGTGASWEWYTGSCGGNHAGSGTFITVTPSPSVSHFYVRAEGNCNNTSCATVPVTITPQSALTSVTGPSPLCVGDVETFVANGAVLGGGTGAWTSDNSYVAAVNASGEVTAQNAGTATITYTISGGCGGSVSDSISVVVNPPPDFSVSTTDANCGYCDGTATATSGFSSYSWSSGGSSDTETGLCGGNYSVTVSDTNGCTNSESFIVDDSGTIPIVDVVTTDPACPGNCDGTATVNATGPPTFVYNYSDGSTPNNQTTGGLCSGSYNVTVADGSNPVCLTVESFTIDNPSGMTLTMSGTDAHCGLANGSASVTVGGNYTMPLNYNWSNGDITGTASDIPAGTYSVTVTDGNGCTAEDDITITDTDAPTITISNSTDITCFGDNDGTATVSVGGGDPPFDYEWSTTPAQYTATAVNLGPGTHYVTVIDTHGCSYEANTTIDEPAELTVDVIPSTIDCFGDCNGSAHANPSGGTVPYTYLWSDFQTSQVADNLCAGDYTVTVTDDNNCTTVGNVTIDQNTEIIVDADITEADCGLSNGEIDLTVSGGSNPYDFDWDHGTHTEDLMGIPAGTYEVTITDNTGCEIIEVFTVDDTPGPNVTISSTTNASCNNSCDGEATVNVTGGTGPFDYQWNTSPVQTNPTATNLCAGSYTVEVTDMATGCIVLSSATITEPDQLDVSALTIDPSCNNACDGEIDLTTFDGTPSYSYTWNGPGTLPSSENLTGLCDGTYSVLIEDANGCSISRTYTLSEPDAIELTTSVEMTNCNGSCDGEATVNAINGTAPYTYQWDDPNNQTSQVAVNLCPGSYNVTVTDHNGCTANAVINVPEPPSLEFASTSTSSTNCYGSNDGEAEVTMTGGTSPYTYNWSNGDITNIANDLPAGTHCVTVLDDNNCSVDTCLIIDQPDAIDVVMDVTDESCNGHCDGVITAIVTGGAPGYSYNWSNASTSDTNDNLCVGVYQLTVTDNNGCEHSSSASVNGPAILNIVVQDTVMPYCGNSDGSITVGGTGGTSPYSYAWENFPSNTTNTLDNIPNGNYTVSVTDDHGCSTMLTIDLNDIPAPVVDSVNITNVDCYGNATGEAEVFFTSATSSNTINWNDPEGQSGAYAINLEAGQYTVEIIDDNGCTTIETITITEPDLFDGYIDSYTDPTCDGYCNGTAQAAYTGGTPPVTYSWTGGYNGQNISGLCAGTYNVTAIDNNGCTSDDEFTISEPSPMTITTDITSVTCPGGNDGAISVSVNGGTGNYDYEWIGTTSNSPIVSGLSSADYTVIVYNANDHNCFITQDFFVPEPDPIDATFGSENATCNLDNGTAYVVSITGGTPGYNYSWNPGNITGTDSATNLAPGSYVCQVEDAYGCEDSFDVNVDETSAPQLDNTIAEGVTCYGYNDGYGEVVVSGGTEPYTYQWSSNVTDQPVHDSLEAGLYMVTITDMDGCNVFATIPISSPDELVALTSDDDTVCIGQTTNINVAATGGTEPYNYEWETLGSGAAHNVSPEVTTDYIVTVIDEVGCSSEPETVEIVVRPPLDLVVASQGAVCLGQTATLQATASGGDGDYIYNWGHGIVTNNPQLAFSPETHTHFEVILTDGCGTPADTADITLSVSPQPVIDIIRTPSKGCAPLNVTFDNNTTNHTYTYQWNFDDEASGDNDTSTLKRPVHYFEESGYYKVSVVVTTDQGCVDSTTVKVSIKENPTADFVAKPWTAGAYTTSIHFNNLSVGSTSWKWLFGDESTSTKQNPDYIFEEFGDIPVTLIAYNNIGCTDTITQEVQIIEEHRFYAPNAINLHSPGNNEFYPIGVGIDYDFYQMSIFNRWGELIFTTNDIEEHWLGRTENNKGDYVQNGIYTWVITLRDKFGKDHRYSGEITVFK